MGRIVLLAAMVLSTLGCASWQLKKQCNGTNWFTYGEGVAMKGQRLDQDNFVKSCEKVEADVDHVALDRGFKKGMANYCEPETAYQTGRKGEFFSKDMCDTPKIRTLLAKHQAGVKDYCRAKNGYAAGASGKKYNFICPKELEDTFLPEFNRGRKAHLQGSIDQKQIEVSQIDGEITRLERQKRDLNQRLSDVNSGGRIRIKDRNRTIEIGGRNRGDSESEQQEKDRIESDIRDVNWQIQAKEQSKKTLLNEIGELRKELVTL